MSSMETTTNVLSEIDLSLETVDSIKLINVYEYINDSIDSAVRTFQSDIQKKVTEKLLALEDDELIFFINARNELSSTQSMCVPKSWERFFVKCNSFKVCEWIVNNMEPEDFDVLTAHIKILSNKVSLKQIAISVWKIPLTKKWIKSAQ